MTRAWMFVGVLSVALAGCAEGERQAPLATASPPAAPQAPRAQAVAGLSSPKPSVRRAALDGVEDSELLVQAVVSDSDPLVRRWAALALERRGDPELTPVLRQALAGEPDPAVRHILGRAIARGEG